MLLRDVTGVVPTRRMSVARGTLAGAGDPAPEALAAARVAAVLAAKDAARLVPALLPFHPTDAFCDLEAGASGLVCTVTVQGYARTRISSAALAGAAAALLSLLESLGHPEGARIEGLHTVQDVGG
ncbi:MAG TPA: cyclic pyranopterin monophosphate synthase MoaC [Candidatus Thermoplasmatota archaeon]|nr:cyclic pyranopterin monophosphate synthase MoaC [Candidatus Thermoplasmatota archaeon]